MVVRDWSGSEGLGVAMEGSSISSLPAVVYTSAARSAKVTFPYFLLLGIP